MSLLEVENVTKRFGSLVAVQRRLDDRRARASCAP